MRIICFLCCFWAFLSMAASAQYTKTFSVGSGFAYSSSKNTKNMLSNRISEFIVSPNLVYGINENWSIGLAYVMAYQQASYDDTLRVVPEATGITNLRQGGEVFIRYYYPFGEKIGFISTLQGRLLSGNSLREEFAYRATYREQAAQFFIGLQFFPIKKFSIEANFNIISYNKIKINKIFSPNQTTESTLKDFNIIGSSMLPVPQIGFRYYFLQN